jgi:hypothetical protein
MATWQKYDGLESRESKVGAACVDLLEHLRSAFPDIAAEHSIEIMGAAQFLTDKIRDARKAARDSVILERGHR